MFTRHGKQAHKRVMRAVQCVFFFCSCALFQFVMNWRVLPTANAASTIGMSADVGFSGYYGPNDWVPVNVKMYNRGSSSYANLVVNVNQKLTNSRIALGTLTWPIHVAAKGWTKIQIYVPGFLINGGASVDCEEGRTVVAGAVLNGNPVSNVSLVAVLAKNTASAQFLTGSSDGNPVLPVTVSNEDFPTRANLLNSLRAVVASPEMLQTLNSSQRDALRTWVELGGLLLVTGTNGTTPTWQSDFPMTPGKERKVPGDGLNTFSQGSIAPPNSITTYVNATVPGTTIWAESKHVPLLASKMLDRGAVWQTSFSPTDQALLGWPGNPAFWTSVLQQGSSNPESSLVPLLSPSGVLSLAAASDALAPLSIPSLRFWVGVFVIYIVVIGPIVFYVLRKLHRAAWAWAVLPLFSALVTAGIYIFGTTVRPHGLLKEGVGVLELTGNGSAETYGITAFMSPFSGGLLFQADQSLLTVPLAEPSVVPIAGASVMNQSNTSVAFGHVSPWSMRYLYAGGAVNNQGQLSVDLSSAFGTLYGSIQNNTPYRLHSVAMFWEGRMYNFGDLAPGEVRSVDELAQPISQYDNWVTLYSTYNHELTRGIGRPLATFAASQTWASTRDAGNEDDAMFVATTDGTPPSLMSISTDQDIAATQTVVLVRQFASVHREGGGLYP